MNACAAAQGCTLAQHEQGVVVARGILHAKAAASVARMQRANECMCSAHLRDDLAADAQHSRVHPLSRVAVSQGH